MAKRFRAAIRRSRVKRVRRTMRKMRVSRKKITRQKNSVKLGRGFPKKVVMSHKYVTRYNTNVFGSGVTNIQMRANDLFDPEVALGGHQPLYFDQMTPLYNHFTVIGARVKWTISRTGGGNGQQVLYIVPWINDDSATSITDIATLAEQTNARIRTLEPGGGNSVTGNNRSIVSQKFSAKKFFGNFTVTQAQYKGNASSSPSEQAVFQLSMSTNGLAAENVNVDVLVEVSYIAVWTEPREIGGS